MKCRYCRAEQTKLDAKFCPTCGSSRELEIYYDNITNRERQNNQDNHEKPEAFPVQKLNKKGTIITVSILVFIGIIVVIIGLSGPLYDHTDHPILGTWHLADNPNYIYYFTLEDRRVGSVPTYRGKHTLDGYNLLEISYQEFFWEIRETNARNYIIIDYGNSGLSSRSSECSTNNTSCSYYFTFWGNGLRLINRDNSDDGRTFFRVE